MAPVGWSAGSFFAAASSFIIELLIRFHSLGTAFTQWKAVGVLVGQRVFVRSNGVWSQQQELSASDGLANDYFGYSVSVSGDTAVVGAYHKNGYLGAAYVFVRSEGVRSPQQELTAPDGAAGDYFGDSVSVSRDTAVIGAFGKNRSQGAAYVFVRSGGVWGEQQELTAFDGLANDYFGYSVSVSGDKAVIGAYWNVYRGAAYVFVRGSGLWNQQQKLTASDGAFLGNFGYSVSVSGDTAVIGTTIAAAYVFVRGSGVWSQQQKLVASDGSAYDSFGWSVSASGDTAVIGDSGKAAYVLVGPLLGANTFLVGSAAGASSVVLASTGTWTAAANDSFLHISAGSASGAGNAVVVFTYDAFTGTGTRTGTLTIAGLTVTLTQAGTNYIRPGALITLPVSSGLEQPSGVAVDGSGNVYIADSFDQAIKEWSPSTQAATTLVSIGSGFPDSVAVDSAGNVYIADETQNITYEWSVATPVLTALVSTGLRQPYGVAVDDPGNVYIADSGSN